MQRIVFFGNCQMGALAQVYQRSVVPRTHDHVTWVRTWEDAEPETYDALRDADLVVEQVLNTPLRLTLDQFETAAKVIGVPNVLNGFLWPYAGEPHPLNSPIPNRPQGPFIPDMSDRFLNRLIRKGVDPDEALRTYIEMDVVKISNVERVREISVGWQRSLDERCGFDFANTIERSFRDEHLFSHPGHPRLRFARYFVASVFRRIGVSVHAVEQAVTMMLEPPFPRGELPIHPKIAKFFDLKFVKPNQKYITITGEYLTFEEYFQRYLRYEWNNKLFQLTIRARDRNLDDDDLLPLIHDFRRELATSCVPSEGHFLLAKLLIRCGQGDKAVEVLRTLGLPLIGWREEDYRQISEFLTARGQLSEAESYIRMGIEAFPDSSELYHQLGVVLFRGGAGTRKRFWPRVARSTCNPSIRIINSNWQSPLRVSGGGPKLNRL